MNEKCSPTKSQFIVTFQQILFMQKRNLEVGGTGASIQLLKRCEDASKNGDGWLVSDFGRLGNGFWVVG